MATRKLIIAALCCGLAILLAGGIWLVASGKDDAKTSPLLEAGQQAKVGGLGVTVLGVGFAVSLVRARHVERDRVVLGFGLLSLVLFFGPTTLGRLATLLPGGGDLLFHRFDPAIEPGATAQCFMLFTLDSPQPSVAGFTTVYSRDNDIAAWLLQ